MKINTEVVQKSFIVTCKGARLDASFAQSFFNSMQGFIQKGHMDIVLDLSSVEFVDSTGLGAIVRCLKEINGRGELVLCGVNTMVLSLLKMTRLDNVFIQAASRSEALEMLQVEQEKKKAAAPPPEPEVTPAPAPSKSKGFDESLLSSLTMEDDGTVHGVDSAEKRRHRRITNKQILSEDIVIHCTNNGTGKRSTAVVLDISPSGILAVSPSTLTVGDEFIIGGRIGDNFKFRERAVIRNCSDGKYGFEFLKPSQETTSFLHQLTGAIMLSPKGRIER
jgi:anti-sigma B factor antagonist